MHNLPVLLQLSIHLLQRAAAEDDRSDVARRWSLAEGLAAERGARNAELEGSLEASSASLTALSRCAAKGGARSQTAWKPHV